MLSEPVERLVQGFRSHRGSFALRTNSLILRRTFTQLRFMQISGPHVCSGATVTHGLGCSLSMRRANVRA